MVQWIDAFIPGGPYGSGNIRLINCLQRKQNKINFNAIIQFTTDFSFLFTWLIIKQCPQYLSQCMLHLIGFVLIRMKQLRCITNLHVFFADLFF